MSKTKVAYGWLVWMIGNLVGVVIFDRGILRPDSCKFLCVVWTGLGLCGLIVCTIALTTGEWS